MAGKAVALHSNRHSPQSLPQAPVVNPHGFHAPHPRSTVTQPAPGKISGTAAGQATLTHGTSKCVAVLR